MESRTVGWLFGWRVSSRVVDARIVYQDIPSMQAIMLQKATKTKREQKEG